MPRSTPTPASWCAPSSSSTTTIPHPDAGPAALRLLRFPSAGGAAHCPLEDSMNELAKKKCKPCEGGVAPITPEQARPLLKGLQDWKIEAGKLAKVYNFKNYYETMAFVNAVAWISHREDHHPDLGVHYNKCRVEYSTHAIGGLSENDFICAAKCDALFDL